MGEGILHHFTLKGKTKFLLLHWETTLYIALLRSPPFTHLSRERETNWSDALCYWRMWRNRGSDHMIGENEVFASDVTQEWLIQLSPVETRGHPRSSCRTPSLFFFFFTPSAITHEASRAKATCQRWLSTHRCFLSQILFGFHPAHPSINRSCSFVFNSVILSLMISLES